MRSTGPRSAFLIAAFLILACWVVVWGVIPGVTRIDTDFPNYYVSGTIVASGTGINRLYDDSWFQSQIYERGIPVEGRFSPFPPVTAMVCAPLALFSPLTAMRLVTVLNVSLVICSAVMLSRILNISPLESGIFVLLSGIGLINCLRFGQMYIAVSASMILGYLLLLRRRPRLSGATSALFIPLKYFPVVMIIYLFMKREWRGVVAAVLTFCVIVASAVLVMGWSVHEAFLTSVLGSHLNAAPAVLEPYSSAYQSWNSLLGRLFVYDAARNPAPLFAASWLLVALKVTIVVATAVACLYAIHAMLKSGVEQRNEIALGMLGIAAMLVAPATATYHFVLFWLPVGLLLKAFRDAGMQSTFMLALALYSAIGFIPYSLFRGFDGVGVLTILAYPRLIMLVALFCTVVTGAKRLSLLRIPAGRPQILMSI